MAELSGDKAITIMEVHTRGYTSESWEWRDQLRDEGWIFYDGFDRQFKLTELSLSMLDGIETIAVIRLDDLRARDGPLDEKGRARFAGFYGG